MGSVLETKINNARGPTGPVTSEKLINYLTSCQRFSTSLVFGTDLSSNFDEDEPGVILDVD